MNRECDNRAAFLAGRSPKDQNVNSRNDRLICKVPSEIPVVMHTKFPATVMVLGVISDERDFMPVMPPHFFRQAWPQGECRCVHSRPGNGREAMDG